MMEPIFISFALFIRSAGFNMSSSLLFNITCAETCDTLFVGPPLIGVKVIPLGLIFTGARLWDAFKGADTED